MRTSLLAAFALLLMGWFALSVPRCTIAGDQRIKVLMTSDEVREPVTKEESTRVFGDE